jgi:predicted MPP superfamily phosphohydrolase
MRRRTLHPPRQDHLEHLELDTPAVASPRPRHLLNPKSGWFRTLERNANLFLSRYFFSRLPGRTVPYSLQLLRHLTVSEGDFVLRGLARPLDGLRVLAITDIHAGPFLAVSALESAFARFLMLEPDVILVGGDVATTSLEELAPHMGALRSLRAPLGTFFVLGNHDHYTKRVDELRKQMERVGLRVLENEAVRIERDGAGLLVAGIDDWLVGDPDLAAAVAGARSLDADAPIVLLSHNPDVFFEAARAGVSLVISGHTHGGQMRVPGLPVLVRMSRYRLDEGRYRARGAEIVVSRGLGVSGIPVRTACPPEALLLTLRCETRPVGAPPDGLDAGDHGTDVDLPEIDRTSARR